jgi:hypothetical protein
MTLAASWVRIAAAPLPALWLAVETLEEEIRLCLSVMV